LNESVVKVTQNWFLGLPKSGPELVKSVADFGCILSLFFTEKIGVRRVDIDARLCQQKIKQKRIFGLDLFQFF